MAAFTVGDSYDNALAETINGLDKPEPIRHRGPWRTVEQVKLATREWVGWWNNQRLHGEFDYRTPNEFEPEYYAGLESPKLAPARHGNTRNETQGDSAMFSTLRVNAHSKDASFIPDLAEAEMSEVIERVMATIDEITKPDGAPERAHRGTPRAQTGPRSGTGHTAPHAARSGRFTTARPSSRTARGQARSPAKLPFDEGSNVAHLAEPVGFEP